MPLTNSDVMSRTNCLQKVKIIPYTGYNAILYARWLPIAILSIALSGFILILSFFLLPWFYTENLLQQTSQFFGPQVASNSVLLLARMPPYRAIYSFPLLWLLVVLGIALVVLAMLLLIGKLITPSLSLFIKLTFGFALLIEVIYLFVNLYVQYIEFNGPTGADPSSGAWVCLLVTCIAGGVCLILFSKLSWHWLLAQEDVEMVAKKTNFRPIWTAMKFYNK